MHTIQIITPSPDRWAEYKALKLLALKQEPSAFSQTFEEKKDTPDEKWEGELRRIEQGEEFLFFAQLDGKLVGMAGFHLHNLSKFRHNAFLFGLFVPQEHRGKGIGKILTEYRMDEIAKLPQIKNIFCEIVTTQTASIDLHKKLGFEIVGELKNLLFTNGKYHNEYWLEKQI